MCYEIDVVSICVPFNKSMKLHDFIKCIRNRLWIHLAKGNISHYSFFPKRWKSLESSSRASMSYDEPGAQKISSWQYWACMQTAESHFHTSAQTISLFEFCFLRCLSLPFSFGVKVRKISRNHTVCRYVDSIPLITCKKLTI